MKNGKKNNQLLPSVNKTIRTLAEQNDPKRLYAFYEDYHDESYISSHDSRATVKLKEQREDRIYYLRNSCAKELVVYKIDGGLLASQKEGDNKCDFGIYTEDELLILIELKGKDYKKAVIQILNTIKELGLNNTNPQKVKKLLARVVLSKGGNVPNLRTTELTALKQVLQKYGGNLLPMSQTLEETLSKIQ